MAEYLIKRLREKGGITCLSASARIAELEKAFLKAQASSKRLVERQSVLQARIAELEKALVAVVDLRGTGFAKAKQIEMAAQIASRALMKKEGE